MLLLVNGGDTSNRSQHCVAAIRWRILDFRELRAIETMAGELILIVDDVPVNLKLVGAVLRREGYNVETASDGEEALEMLRTLYPDLILSDIQMPVVDGFELTRRVKQDERLRHIPVVALTALALKSGEEKAFEVGFDGYLTKPIDTRTMGLRVREYLDRRPAPSCS